MSFVPTIGLEVHAELCTASKLFCGCENNPNEKEPNVHVCPVCMGYPGALPVTNKQAVTYMLRIGAALQGSRATQTRFDRKHYFYPDMPKGYQISQHAEPFISHASLCGVPIRRVHLEEDTARSVHDTNIGSCIDFNRSGVPLMELVTEPTLHDAESAVRFAEELQLLLRTLAVARARMEWGEMRVEANISVSASDTLGTKVEVKNLNSLRAVRDAIAYEIQRQCTALERGEAVTQETRGWNEHRSVTYTQRSKEDAEEYRYVHDADLPDVRVAQEEVWHEDVLRASLPELPWQKQERYTRIGVPSACIPLLVHRPVAATLFDAALQEVHDIEAVRLTAHYVTSDIYGLAEKHGDDVFTRITGTALRDAISMFLEGALSSRGVKQVLALLAVHSGDTRETATTHALLQDSNEDTLQASVTAVCTAHPHVVAAYQSGKKEVLQFLVGQVMKETKGRANPQKVQKLLHSVLSASE